MTESAAQGLPAQGSPQDLPAQGLIAQRLNHLFETVHPPGRGPYSLREVVEAINEDAGAKLMSAAYLSQLRTGQRTEPSHSRLAAIAKFFGVDIRYFADDATAQATDEQLEFLGAMRDSGVRAVAIRAAGLSDTALEAVKALIDTARRLEGLGEPETPAAPPSVDSSGEARKPV
jgi:transcriptional regulator with XRE-family HTH domain